MSTANALNAAVANKGVNLYASLVSSEPPAIHAIPILSSDERSPYATMGQVHDGDGSELIMAMNRTYDGNHYIFLDSVSDDHFVDDDMKPVLCLSTVVAMCFIMNHPRATVKFDMDDEAMLQLRFMGATSMPSMVGAPVLAGTELSSKSSKLRTIRSH
tara:strand:+ start:51 stop:524 length:474 start_codon:yes stop_codon:yes gene_type:complete